MTTHGEQAEGRDKNEIGRGARPADPSFRFGFRLRPQQA
jgi:hypothetical protein